DNIPHCRRQMLPGAVPIHRPGDSLRRQQQRPPTEALARLRRIEPQELRFIGAAGFSLFDDRALLPIRDDEPGQFADRDGVILGWAEVPGGGEPLIALDETFAQEQIASEGFENVLPGADGIRPPEHAWLAGDDAANEIRDDAVRREIAAADDVAGS